MAKQVEWDKATEIAGRSTPVLHEVGAVVVVVELHLQEQFRQLSPLRNGEQEMVVMVKLYPSPDHQLFMVVVVEVEQGLIRTTQQMLTV
jgi:hypothetical protein